jgi:ABC-type sugar transport system ATPase subunit
VIADVVLRGTGLSKAYGTVTALDGVDVEIRAGQITAIVGDNGAGKSTLIKILSGATRPDSGTIEFAGRQVSLGSPTAARSLGIETVYQDLALAPNRDVVENLFLGRELCRGGVLTPFRVLDRRGMRRRAESQIAELEVNVPRISGIPIGRMSGGQRQAIAIARTVHSDADIILLDEPLAAMGAKEGAMILDLVARMRAEGNVSIIMIAHNYVHVLESCDRVNLIQDGEITFDKPTADTSVEELNEIVVEEYRRARAAAQAG